MHHIAPLDALIIAGHQALNADRAIPPAEWWGLLALEQEYGRDAVLRWQRRAAGAGRSEVRLAYYEACAANTAFASVGAGRAQYGRTEPENMPQALPLGEHLPGTNSVTGRSAPTVTVQPLDRNRALLLAGIERLMGRTVRHPELLADVSLSRLVRWREIADHPGLRVWNDPLGYLIAEAVAGNDPPSGAELDAWAQQAGVHWLDPQLAAWHDTEEEWEEWEDTAGTNGLPDSYSLHADSLPDAPHERSATLLEALIEMLPGRYMPLLDRLVIQVDDDGTCISCADQVLYAAACELQAVIRDALLDLGLSDEIRICAPAPTQPTELRGAPPAHPGWIDEASWLMLEDDLCAALVGSALAPDGGLDVRAEAYEVICAHFAAPVRDLLAAAQARASP